MPLEHQACPVVFGGLAGEREVVFAGFLDEDGDVFGVEAAEHEGASVGHDLAEGVHVGEEDVAVDVCHDELEDAAHVGEHGGVAVEHVDEVLHLVELGVVAGVVDAPFVDVVGHHVAGSELGGYDGYDAGAASAVEHLKAVDVHVGEGGDDHASGLVGARSECHACVDADAEGSEERGEWGGALLACVVDDAFAIDDDGVEACLFPGGVPVAVFGLGHLEGDVGVGDGEVVDGLLQAFTVERIGLDIAREPLLGVLERLEAHFARAVGQQLATRLQEVVAALDVEINCVVFHDVDVLRNRRNQENQKNQRSIPYAFGKADGF